MKKHHTKTTPSSDQPTIAPIAPIGDIGSCAICGGQIQIEGEKERVYYDAVAVDDALREKSKSLLNQVVDLVQVHVKKPITSSFARNAEIVIVNVRCHLFACFGEHPVEEITLDQVMSVDDSARHEFRVYSGPPPKGVLPIAQTPEEGAK